MTKLYEVPAEFAAKARSRREDYDRLYQESVRDPDGFWGRMGRRLDWMRPYTRVKDVSYDAGNFHIRWYEDGQPEGSSLTAIPCGLPAGPGPCAIMGPVCRSAG